MWHFFNCLKVCQMVRNSFKVNRPRPVRAKETKQLRNGSNCLNEGVKKGAGEGGYLSDIFRTAKFKPLSALTNAMATHSTSNSHELMSAREIPGFNTVPTYNIFD